MRAIVFGDRADQLRWLLLFTAAFLGFLTTSAHCAIVERVVDGDTVRFREIGTARLIGIDTPETVHPRKPVEVCGPEASAALKAALPAGARVRLTYGPQRRDKHKRTLAYIWKGSTLVNLQLVQQGLARAERRYPHPRMGEFVRAEHEAAKARRGLWADPPCGGGR